MAHHGDIVADETWAGDGTVHHVTFSINVRGVTLTIAPCAVVQLDPSYGIELDETAGVGAKLVARGTSSTPIVFERADPTQPWGTILSYYASTLMDLSHVTLRGGGVASGYAATILVRGAGDDTVASPVLRVQAVTIDGSESGGVSLESSAAFTDDSTDLTVSSSGTLATHYPIAVTPIAIGSIPPGHYAGNSADTFLVAAGILFVRRSVTVHARGLAYYWRFDRVRVYDEGGSAVPTLTIEPGVELRFDDYILVGKTGSTDYPGVISAVGTPTAPIVFTTAQATKAAGSWPGVWLELAAGSRLENVRIEYSGGPYYASSANCRPTDSGDDAALMLGWDADKYVPSASDFAAVTIAHSAGHGINAMWTTGSFGPDVTAGFTFDAIAGCRQTKNGTTSGCLSQPGCLVP